MKLTRSLHEQTDDDRFGPAAAQLTTTAATRLPTTRIAERRPRGPLLLQDYQLIERLAHQNRERIPERPVHAKGWGAHGTLTITGDISKYTRAKVLQPGAKTPLILRFSTVAGELGAADAERDVRGFAIKFYTEEGNWDLVGNNTPVFFVRDPYKFPTSYIPRSGTQRLICARRPRCGFLVLVARELAPVDDPDVRPGAADRCAPHQRLWFAYLQPGQRGRRTGVGEVSLQDPAGPPALDQPQASDVVGRTRESTQEDLFGAIEKGDFPRWKCRCRS